VSPSLRDVVALLSLAVLLTTGLRQLPSNRGWLLVGIAVVLAAAWALSALERRRRP
jgi:predicted Abi (CAAX) family protease